MKAETFDIYLKPYIHDDLTSNLGRLCRSLMENTSLVAEFNYRPIKMLLTHYFTTLTTRGQPFIPVCPSLPKEDTTIQLIPPFCLTFI